MWITRYWWHVVNQTRTFKCSKSIVVQQLVLSWQQCSKLFDWSPLEYRKDRNYLEVGGMENLKSKFNWMARLGFVTMEDDILELHRQWMTFQTIQSRFQVPCGYGYPWQWILTSSTLDSPIWWSKINICGALMMYTISWLKVKRLVNEEGFGYMAHYPMFKMVMWSFGCKMVFSSPICVMAFLWRVMFVRLPLMLALKWRRLSDETYFFYASRRWHI